MRGSSQRRKERGGGGEQHAVPRGPAQVGKGALRASESSNFSGHDAAPIAVCRVSYLGPMPAGPPASQWRRRVCATSSQRAVNVDALLVARRAALRASPLSAIILHDNKDICISRRKACGSPAWRSCGLALPPRHGSTPAAWGSERRRIRVTLSSGKSNYGRS
ncbi:hypothetical protein K505DRAFT_39304 [Melanomma pulvis-pyrius CBS 109.77]|uniref:Uncharacterized protein n=1 Tax=Melanomma pulvis-pyrius CBS 109.77 TaxID=1314802 RepID=A0A6A6XAS3_9PLEO|nr:hypothetical protein K505DRAFT_39304 [Melanomma pulvis-pyrius CBS 109.77]